MLTPNQSPSEAKAGSGDGKNPTAPPSISLPKGGGAIRGMGEKFAANPVTGTGSMSVPIATSPGRSGFGPQLSLAYDSGAGNGPFGFGWRLSLPSITRKTDKGLPRYLDGQDQDDDRDVFILSGAEDLVPVLRQDLDGSWVAGHAGHSRDTDGAWVRDAQGQYVIHEDARTVDGLICRVRRYRPRIEGLFARIERWTNSGTGEVFWRSISKDNVTTWYGRTAESRVADPADATRVFSWLICETHDDKGNVLVYGYKAEDSTGVEQSQEHERNRTDISRSAQRYLKRVRYGNHAPYFPELKAGASWPEPTGATDRDGSRGWHFEVVFDYGEHQADAPTPDDAGPWDCRQDPFSTYRPGFEVRTYRTCRRVLMFHHFPNEPEVRAGCLVRSTELDYSYEKNPGDARNPIYSFLCSVTQSGFKRQGAAGYLKKSLPPVEFTYSAATIQEEICTVDAGSLENLPDGLDGSACQWVDLDGEGFCGILTEQGGSWFYKRNLSPLPETNGGGTPEVKARFASLELVASNPAASLANQAQFMDLAGDGQPDVVVFDGPVCGFYERTNEAGWVLFRPFRSFPNLDTRDPNLKFVDLDGDGHADILISEDDAFRWYPSLAEDGFGPAQFVRKSCDEEKGPALVFDDGTQSVYLADLSGDGLADLVCILNGNISYYPSLGYGRFGPRVTMDNSPWFDTPDQFDQKRLRLADIDGSGTTDIIYLHADGPRIYFNQSGNSWSAARPLTAFPSLDSVVSIQVLDLLGNGTACLVWSSPLPGDSGRQMRYLDLLGQKPHLLVKTVNNLGAETRVQYAPSTKFYLQDKQDGKPWITKLPFPVHVIQCVETYDHISRNRFVTRYAYHHGYFDGEEREFRGFGMVEQWDTEEFSALASSGQLTQATNIDAASHVPPVHTRTWFHTGIYLGRDRVSNFFADLVDADDAGEYYREPGLTDAQARELLLEDTVLPSGLTAEEEREACRALKGSMLRHEVYADDALAGSSPEQVQRAHTPYTVTEQNFTIEYLQPREGRNQGVFFAHPREALTYHYERNPADPRVQHALTLDVDHFGNVLKSLAIGYGRRAPSIDPVFTAEDKSRQSRLLMTITANRFTNAIADNDACRSPLPAESRTFELTGFVPNNGMRFNFGECVQNGFTLLGAAEEIPYEQVPDLTLKQKRLIDHVRTLYRRDDLTAQLALGVVETRALPGESYKLALTPSLTKLIFNRRETGEELLPGPAAILEGKGPDQGGYVAMDGNWWIPSGRFFFDLRVDVTVPSSTAARELSTARLNFFLPRKIADPFNQSTTVDYDAYNLLTIRTRDPLGNTVTSDNDYRVLQPTLVTDPNRNRTKVAFDALGMVAGTAVMGKTGRAAEGDSLDGFVADPAESVVLTRLADPLANPHALLKKATIRQVYDLFAYYRTRNSPRPEPPVVYTLARETHVADLGRGEQTEIQHSFSYSDGFGREIQKKIRAEPGPVPRRDANGRILLKPDGQPRMTNTNVNPRWVGSGWSVFNNKGQPIRKYEPFFTDTHQFELDTRIGVSGILFYDPVGRVIATLHPNHTYEKTIFYSWQQTTHDVNDTITGVPNADADVKGFFVNSDGTPRIPVTEFLPTWYDLRTNSAHASEASGRWPNARLRDAERDAANQTVIQADTPSTVHLDTLGRPFLTVAHNRFRRRGTIIDEKYATRVLLDIEGNQREVIDARDRIVMRYDYDLLGTRIHQASMEAGERWMLNDATGKPIRAWDSRHFLRRLAYDELRRPIELHVLENGAERLAERSVYGESRGDAKNNRGRIYQIFDGAGIVTSEEYDFKGNLRKSRRDLLRYDEMVDWDLTLTANDGSFIIENTFDALNRPTSGTSPDKSVYRPTFNEASLLETVQVNLRDAARATRFVTNIDYDAKGQRQVITYGNGAETNYEYDPFTFRLTRMTTTRPSDPDATASQLFKNREVVQDLLYTYDPAGNIVRIEDAAFKTIVYSGQTIEPVCEYAYDALYRLIEARGREHIGQTASEFDPPEGNRRDYPFFGNQAHPNDLRAFRNYTERYEYDAVGNFTLMNHVGKWRRTYKYDEDSLVEFGVKSNRLTSTSVGNGATFTEDYTYADASGHDVHGCMTAINQMAMGWDFKDQLRQVDLGGGGRARYIYDAGGQRTRKVIETQAGVRRKERIYVGGYEVYREYESDGVTPARERESLHVMDDKRRIVLVETLTIDGGNDVNRPAPLHRYQFSNHLGSASVELDRDGAVISYEEYHPYGTTSFQTRRSGAEISLKRYRYTGKERDEESGLCYYGGRYYQPWLGKWLTCDPKGLSEGLNLYSFCSNSPIARVDPDGRADVSVDVHSPDTPTRSISTTGSQTYYDNLNGPKVVPSEPQPANEEKPPPSFVERLIGNAIMDSIWPTTRIRAQRPAVADVITAGASFDDIMDKVDRRNAQKVSNFGSGITFFANQALTAEMMLAEFAGGMAAGAVAARAAQAASKAQARTLMRASDEFAEFLLSTAKSKTEAKWELGPVLTTVLDTETGEVFHGLNIGRKGAQPTAAEIKHLKSILHPLLKARLEKQEKLLAEMLERGPLPEEVLRASVAGTHSEVIALNKAIEARIAKTGRDITENELSSFLLRNKALVGPRTGGSPPPCFHCSPMIEGTSMMFERIPHQ